MNLSRDHFQELNDLLELLCTGEIDQPRLERMQAIVLQSNEARDLYLEAMQIHRGLEWLFRDPEQNNAALPSSIPLPPTRPFALPSRSPVLGFLGSISRHVPGGEFTVGSLLLIVIVAAFWGLSQAILFPRLGGHNLAEESSHPPTVPSSDLAVTVATIRDTSDVEWSPESKSPLAPGKGRGAGGEGSAIAENQPLSIASGLIELQLTGGTTLLIEGPADWKINGENSATLTRGKLVAKVPRQAVGFTLETPTARIIDLGTEFGVEVVGEKSEVRVIKGLVDVQGAGGTGNGKSKTVKAGQSVKITEAGPATPEQTTLPDKFQRLVDAGNKKDQIATKVGSPLERWRVASQKLRTDPSLVAYYDFESQGAQLRNVLGDKLHGEIITTREKVTWTQGRWYGKHALAFGKDFSSVSIPDDPALRPKGDFSFAVWFRVDSNPPPHTFAPILGKGDLPNRSYTLWLDASGRLILIANASKVSDYLCMTANSIGTGKWHHAVGMFDSGKMRLFHNGAEVGSPQPMDKGLAVSEQPLKLGRSDHAPDKPHPFSGVIDELVIFNRALSSDEIAEMYRTGKPE